MHEHLDQAFRERVADIISGVEHGYAAAQDVTDTVLQVAQEWRRQHDAIDERDLGVPVRVMVKRVGE